MIEAKKNKNLLRNSTTDFRKTQISGRSTISLNEDLEHVTVEDNKKQKNNKKYR